ncbi:hypothetical protein COV04_00730 [Candidatus Uhrbacteria bacterium CG10_big_fil_rev_8_21_14_0_10_48_11]|uniref:HAD family phosphatase n=1 Tax=Candidatus Uhrbacteria bacterium CG10_big_fil_rev_8_21_14_0_10_48_11 TaxID=1975037 RepID=A0A2M8LFH7_9BACT|nr:MAG: hypothetical protein COV04_00730 [Candidatus Uhrbacteria bacterium CG10_big_fil_rev_8_21_14_0_10_48_11]
MQVNGSIRRVKDIGQLRHCSCFLSICKGWVVEGKLAVYAVLAMIEAIIFDLEGVVINTQKLWNEEGRLFLGRRGIVISAQEELALKNTLMGFALTDGVQCLQERYGFSGDPEALVCERLAIVEELFKRQIGFIEGFTVLWSNLENRYRTAVATGLHPTLLQPVIEKLDLKNYFAEHIYSIADVDNRSKPDPAVFLLAARKLGVPPDVCVVVEDAPNGIAAARATDMRAVGFAQTVGRESLAQADYIIYQLEDLTDYLYANR